MYAVLFIVLCSILTLHSHGAAAAWLLQHRRTSQVKHVYLTQDMTDIINNKADMSILRPEEEMSAVVLHREAARRDTLQLCAPAVSALTQCPLFDRSLRLSGMNDISQDTISTLIPKELQDLHHFKPMLQDMEALARLMLLVRETKECKVTCRLNLLQGVRCPRWHEDNVISRLIVSYFGKGSDWVDPSLTSVRLTNFARHLLDMDPVVSEKHIKNTPVNDILIFAGKGSKNVLPILHRSPLSNVDEKRLLYTITIE